MRITDFRGEHRFLSNFYPAKVNYEGISGKTVEHAFQAAKAAIPVQARWVAGQSTPGNAKRAGRCVEMRPDWEEVKEGIMLALLKQKFADPHLRELLLNTGDSYLEEGNTWGDRYWGVCGGVGKNRLGHLLMKVRSDILCGES